MTERPVDMDAYRSSDRKIVIAFRGQKTGEYGPEQMATAPVHDAQLHAQMLTGPADSWADVTQKAVFLIERYAKTPEAQDSQVQILIRRVLCDMTRLTRREDRKP